jgi:hypothetical protein
MAVLIGSPQVLSAEFIGRPGERAADYDRDNCLFFKDFEELRAAKYLKMLVPRDLGLLGLSLDSGV